MPPPGFGPKLPKPSQKEAVKAAEAVNPADMHMHMLALFAVYAGVRAASGARACDPCGQRS